MTGAMPALLLLPVVDHVVCSMLALINRQWAVPFRAVHLLPLAAWVDVVGWNLIVASGSWTCVHTATETTLMSTPWSLPLFKVGCHCHQSKETVSCGSS
jgi:uncharacterized membrane protein